MLTSQQGDQTSVSALTRRGFFDRLGSGTYGAALAYLLGKDLQASPSSPRSSQVVFDLSARAPHFQPRAKAVIHLVMQGGPSHIDLFDPKPRLEGLRGEAPAHARG